ncbi:hypothetical protein L917_00128 [Phytophthora nicotianae]|uniref:Secreted protein n=1 Tax=Phytophthora nicotianae TaxID=4792 RepID=W2M4C6_PHYNI|nr:hypothetical protein L917_00128 [Phytophthora nicotianae]ETM56971.1 hypothetical protein L914_00139 [Phytophthora nicotianae]
MRRPSDQYMLLLLALWRSQPVAAASILVSNELLLDFELHREGDRVTRSETRMDKTLLAIRTAHFMICKSACVCLNLLFGVFPRREGGLVVSPATQRAVAVVCLLQARIPPLKHVHPWWLEALSFPVLTCELRSLGHR